MFGKKENDQPAAPKEAQSWDDKLSTALPQKATYFDAIRTDAYMNHNFSANYIEFWAAMQVDKSGDKWRVMHYMVFDLDQPDGKFKSETVSKADMSFPEAVYQIAKFDETSKMMLTHKHVDLSAEQYPADKFPEMKVHFFDIENFKVAANIEGIAFDDAMHPYRRVEGKVFGNATFKRSEIAKTILGVEQARENPKVAEKIEGGILSDIFNSASARNASLDNILKVGQTLANLDSFTTMIGAFYLDVQGMLGKDDKFDKIQNMTADEKKDLYSKATGLTRNGESPLSLLMKADKQLDQAKDLGIHIEPFKKFVAECELYTHLLNASQNLKKLEQGFSSTGGANLDLITSIRQCVDKAQEKFMDLGGSKEQLDKLKAWVANPKKDSIPQWLPGFIDRYYDQRRKVMKKVQERQAGVREVNTVTAKVKPPIVE